MIETDIYDIFSSNVGFFGISDNIERKLTGQVRSSFFSLIFKGFLQIHQSKQFPFLSNLNFASPFLCILFKEILYHVLIESLLKTNYSLKMDTNIKQKSEKYSIKNNSQILQNPKIRPQKCSLNNPVFWVLFLLENCLDE